MKKGIWTSDKTWTLRTADGKLQHNNTTKKYYNKDENPLGLITKVGVQLDTTLGELSFWINGVHQPIAYKDVDFQNKEFTPAFELFDDKQSGGIPTEIEILKPMQINEQFRLRWEKLDRQSMSELRNISYENFQN